MTGSATAREAAAGSSSGFHRNDELGGPGVPGRA
jgi:hypothetical protein